LVAFSKQQLRKIGARAYKKQKTPQLHPRIREQRLAYVKLGPVAQLIENGQWEAKKHTIAWIDHTPTSKTGSIGAPLRTKRKRESLQLAPVNTESSLK